MHLQVKHRQLELALTTTLSWEVRVKSKRKNLNNPGEMTASQAVLLHTKMLTTLTTSPTRVSAPNRLEEKYLKKQEPRAAPG